MAGVFFCPFGEVTLSLFFFFFLCCHHLLLHDGCWLCSALLSLLLLLALCWRYHPGSYLCIWYLASKQRRAAADGREGSRERTVTYITYTTDTAAWQQAQRNSHIRREAIYVSYSRYLTAVIVISSQVAPPLP